MDEPRGRSSARWLLLLPLPIVLWALVFGELDLGPGLEPYRGALQQGGEVFPGFRQGERDLDDRQRGLTPVPREFLAASHIVIVGATAIVLLLALVWAMLAPVDGVVDEPSSRTDWMMWAAAAGIVVFLVFALPTPMMRLPSSTAVSLAWCLAAGGAALIVYIKIVGLRARLASRSRLRRGL